MSYTAGIFAPHAQQVLADDRDGKPANTKRAYDGKRDEFLAYCQYAHSGGSEGVFNPFTVTEEKLFGFLYYCSRRPKRPSGMMEFFFSSPIR